MGWEGERAGGVGEGLRSGWGKVERKSGDEGKRKGRRRDGMEVG